MVSILLAVWRDRGSRWKASWLAEIHGRALRQFVGTLIILRIREKRTWGPAVVVVRSGRSCTIEPLCSAKKSR